MSTSAPIKILGIDPGSRLTGYGCVSVAGGKISAVAHGTLRLAGTSGKQTVSLEDRLLSLFQGLTEVIQQTNPNVLVVEKIFFAKNALSALKLGQARGVVVVCGALNSLEIVEYSPTEVKSAVVGHGGADKEQVARMVEIIIGKQKFDTPDASDALALAICHAQRIPRGMARASVREGDVEKSSNAAFALQEWSRGRRSKKRLSLAESVGISAAQAPAPRPKRRVDIPEKT